MSLIHLVMRRGTLFEWATENPILSEGEHGYVTDVGLVKVGDGSTAWNDLRWELRSAMIKRGTLASTDYTILDDDGYESIEVTTGASDRTVTLPTAADNSGREIAVSKADTGAGKVIVAGEGSEKIGIEGNAVTFDLYAQGDRVRLCSNGTLWVVVDTNGPLLALLNSSSIAASLTANVWFNPSGLSLSVPPGLWEPSAKVAQHWELSASAVQMQACLSTANNSASDSDMISYWGVAGNTGRAWKTQNIVRSARLVVAAATTYYLNLWQSTTATVHEAAGSSIHPTSIVFRRVG